MESSSVTLPSRYFNQLLYDPVQQTVTKTSQNEQKLIHEIEWYIRLPKRFHRYIPDIVDYSIDHGKAFITMKYVPFLTLSHILLSKQEEQRNHWPQVFASIHRLMGDLAIESSRNAKVEHMEAMYIDKTMVRLNQFLNQCDWGREIRRRGYVSINGKYYACPMRVFEQHTKDIYQLCHQAKFHITHGDLCFSNIFWDKSTGDLTLIDPRGSFGIPAIYGDHRYDLAKVRHSLSGYEHVINDQFSISLVREGFSYTIAHETDRQAVRRLWDETIGKTVKDVRLIEALLFLSMLPLHREHTNRQMAMFILGTVLLDKALSE